LRQEKKRQRGGRITEMVKEIEKEKVGDKQREGERKREWMER
jgi:hypothetical protein